MAEGSYPKSDGQVLYASEFEQVRTFTEKSLANNARNLVRQLINNDVELKGGGGVFADAYIDSSGRKDTVNTGNSDAVFVSDRYRVGTTDGTPEGKETGTGGSSTSGQTQTAVTIINAGYFNQIGVEVGSGTTTVEITKNGVVVASDSSAATGTVTFTFAATDYKAMLLPGDTVEFEFTPVTVLATSELIQHDIPSGTFSSTISKAFFGALEGNINFSSSTNIQFRLYNGGSDDTGFLDYNEIQSFTAFTAEPTKLEIKLSGTNPGEAGILGFAVYE